jgi:hypothetical protein
VTFAPLSQLRRIEAMAFLDCSSLKSIAIPSSVEYVERLSFCECKSLQTVVFERGGAVSVIKKKAFFHCLSLQSICIPTSVTRIADECFGECKKLSAITFDSPSRLKVLSSIPYISCAFVDISDSVEVLDRDLALNAGHELILTFECNSHLCEIDFSLGTFRKWRNPRPIKRAFVRLHQAALRVFRLDLSNLGA